MGRPELYDTARAVVAAITAIIHTVEWTPAILPSKTMSLAMNNNCEHGPKVEVTWKSAGRQGKQGAEQGREPGGVVRWEWL